MSNYISPIPATVAQFIVLLSLVLSGCSPASTPLAPSTKQPATATTTSAIHPTRLPISPSTAPAITSTGESTAAPSPYPTKLPAAIPPIALSLGGRYFSIDGVPSFVLARNLIGQNLTDFETQLGWTKAAGSRVIRLHLIQGWGGTPWINKDGSVNEMWARNWEQLFKQAEADGIYVIPVFGVWADWNNGTPDYGYPNWKVNPLNKANGGPVAAPGELFQAGSAAQKLWIEWVKSVVTRFQSHKNIAAWEIFSEENIASGAPGPVDAKGGVTETAGADFTNRLVAVIRSADPKGRPITASLAGTYKDTDAWAQFYHLDSLDFIEIHPYIDTLDRELITDVGRKLVKYKKPVMIGESGLWSLNLAENAPLAISHAIWAGVVSGAMDGRALWWQDGYAMNAADGSTTVQIRDKYSLADQAAANFVKGVDFSGFQPLVVSFPSQSKVWGGAVGNDKSVIGWFRDALCEPPNWALQPTISGQTIVLQAPGSASRWKVDFYSTKTGTEILSSTTAVRKGTGIPVALPDFQDDIAFNMNAQP